MTPLRVAAALAVAVGVLVIPVATSAAADVGQCAVRDPQGYCIEWDVPTPGNPGDPGGGGRAECYWVTIPEDLAEDPTIWVDFGLEQPPEGMEIVWQSWECSDGRTTFDFRWVIPATPANLASIARGRLVGELPQPSVASSPPIGTASILGVPVFVEVTNWTGVVSESECAGGLCVTVTATPALSFAPGESGSTTVSCAGSGSRYTPGASPVAQAAAPGACAYAYRLRSGVGGRPAQWPGSVSVTWTISWTASSGVSGSLASITRSTAVPRGVEEVQTVVVRGGTP